MSLFQALYAFFLLPVLTLLFWLIIIRVVMSWLISFNVVNLHNRFVAAVWDISGRLSEPLIQPIRKALPPMAGFDFSPVILLLLILFVRDWLLPGLVFGNLRVF